MNALGDLLFLFDSQSEPPVGRLGNTAWQGINSLPAAWLQPASDAWKGFPFQAFTRPGWQGLILGETPALDSFLPTAIPTADDLARAVASLTGSFLLFARCDLNSTWHTFTDRFATLHAYHAWDGRRAALGTFSPGVAAAVSHRNPDWEALAAWFSFGFFPADRTHCSDVRILRPASHYVFDATGRLLRQERYWQWLYQPDETRTYAETVEAFGQVFGQVMAEALQDGRVAIPISGGLDSRSTVAALAPEMSRTGRLWSYSYGYSRDSIETRIARKVAEARHLPFQPYTIQPYLFDSLERLLAYTEGFQDVTQARQMFVHDEIASHGDAMLAALWGDVWLDEMGLADFPETSEEEVLRHALKKIRKDDGWLFANIVGLHMSSQEKEALLAGFVKAELKSLAHIASPDFRVKAFKTEQWSFRWSIPPTRVFQSTAWPRKVFYDTRLSDFFATVPTEFVSGRKLQIDYLKRFAPDLARITWQVYDANLFHYQYFNSWLVPKRAFKKAKRILMRQRIVERNWEVQFLGERGRQGLRDWLLRPGLRLHEFVAPTAVKDLLDSFYNAPLVDGRGYTVSMLLTFSAWLEKYGG